MNIVNTVTLIINEPLPSMKRLTGEVQDHWLELIHSTIAETAARQKTPYFDKAFVLIEIITPRKTNNSQLSQLWDTSNRAINLVINNLKGIFFEDDNHEHMAFGVVGRWGGEGQTIIRIMPFERVAKLIEK